MAVRNISAEGMRELFAQHSSSAMFALVSFFHPDASSDARIVNNTENITHNGTEYVGLPFQLTLPSNNEEEIPQLTMTVDNVDRTLVGLLRSVDEPPDVTIEVVRVNQSGDVFTEIGPLNFSLLSADINAESITLTIGYANDILNAPATSEIFNPGLAPGLFSA